jgi:hypothetical protein
MADKLSKREEISVGLVIDGIPVETRITNVENRVRTLEHVLDTNSSIFQESVLFLERAFVALQMAMDDLHNGSLHTIEGHTNKVDFKHYLLAAAKEGDQQANKEESPPIEDDVFEFGG